MSTNAVFETLVAARQLIQDPAHTCKGVLARDANGETVWPEDEEAVCWCATGAVRKAACKFDFNRIVAGDCLELLDEASGIAETEPGEPRPIALLNDTAPHTQLLSCFDAAIEKARVRYV